MLIMETKIQKQIIDFFSYFEEFYNTSKTCLKICQNCAVDINKLNQRCRHIKEAQLNGTPLEEFTGLQAKLTASIHNLISDEVVEIRSQLSTIEESFDKLCNKHKVLHESCKNIDFIQQSPLIRGTPLQPPLEKLLQFSSDCITFGSQVCTQIDTSLNLLSYRGLNTSLVDNLKIAANWQKKVPEILAYTSYCSENEI